MGSIPTTFPVISFWSRLFFVTNIMIKKSLLVNRKIFMYPSWERKKCHCAKNTKALPFLFFPSSVGLISTLCFLSHEFEWFFLSYSSWCHLEKCGRKKTTPSWGLLGKCLSERRRWKLKIETILISLHYPSHSARRRQIWVKTLLITWLIVFSLARGRKILGWKLNHLSCMKYVGRAEKIINSRLSNFSFSRFAPKLKEWLNVEKFFLTEGEKILKFMHACPLPRRWKILEQAMWSW